MNWVEASGVSPPCQPSQALAAIAHPVASTAYHQAKAQEHLWHPFQFLEYQLVRESLSSWDIGHQAPAEEHPSAVYLHNYSTGQGTFCITVHCSGLDVCLANIT